MKNRIKSFIEKKIYDMRLGIKIIDMHTVCERGKYNSMYGDLTSCE